MKYLYIKKITVSEGTGMTVALCRNSDFTSDKNNIFTEIVRMENNDPTKKYNNR